MIVTGVVDVNRNLPPLPLSTRRVPTVADACRWVSAGDGIGHEWDAAPLSRKERHQCLQANPQVGGVQGRGVSLLVDASHCPGATESASSVLVTETERLVMWLDGWSMTEPLGLDVVSGACRP